MSSGSLLRLSQWLPYKVPSLTTLVAKVIFLKLGCDCVTHSQLVSKVHQVLRDRFPSPSPVWCLPQLHLSVLWPNYPLQTIDGARTHYSGSRLFLVSTPGPLPISSPTVYLILNTLIHQNHSIVTSSKKSFLTTTLVESIVSILPLLTLDSLPTSIRTAMTFIVLIYKLSTLK